jgi:hypothetical protein
MIHWQNRYALALAAVLAGAFAVILGLFVPVKWQIPAVTLEVLAGVGLIYVAWSRGESRIKRTVQANTERLLAMSSGERERFHRSSQSLGQVDIRLRRVESFSKQSLEMISKATTLLNTVGSRNEADLREIERHLHGHNEALKDALNRIGQIHKQGAHNEIRLRQIGQMVKKPDEIPVATPVVPSITRGPTAARSQTMGRLAAAVSQDPNRADKLIKALTRDVKKKDESGKRKIAVVATSDLEHLLEKSEVSTESLMPSLAEAQIAEFEPSLIIIEQAAFQHGAWYAADSACGAALFEEIQRAILSAADRGVSTYFLRNGSSPDAFTNEIAKLCEITFPVAEIDEPWAADASLGIVRVLQTFVEGKFVASKI